MDQTGLIFDIQRFSTHDGPGIRTTLFLKGCPLRCVWCQNPESLSPRPELAFHAQRCRRTLDCLAACPAGALVPGPDRVVRSRCDACSGCVGACPTGALEVVGRRVTVQEVLAQLVADEPFYRASGGGVTISGGEPTLQAAFLGAVGRALCARSIGVGLQTCGAFRWDDFANLLPLFDFIHFDLKSMDAARHRELTGSDNAIVVDNARRLVAAGAPVRFRIPIVPGYTDSPENLDSTAEFLLGMRVRTVDLLRYHAGGEAKLPRLGSRLRPLGLGGSPRARESFDFACARMRQRGLEVTP